MTSSRLALLLCDTPLPTVVAQHGDYTRIFEALLKASAPSDVNFDLTSYDVVHKMEYPPDQDELDGVLLTGSAASAYENLEWINRLVDWVRVLIKEKPHVKVFGICFGHQIVGRAVGGECVPNSGKWEIGTTHVDLSPIGQSLFGLHTLNIQQMHRDHVPTVPQPLHLLGSSPVCYNQGMVMFKNGTDTSSVIPTDVHVITVQGHPEFTSSISDLVISARASTGVLPTELADDGHRRNKELTNDGVDVIGQLFWKILDKAK